MRIALLSLLLAACGYSSSSPSDAAVATDLLPAPDDLVSGPVGPMKLSETGLYTDFASRTLAPGIFQYAPRFQLWADGAQKRRYLLLPAGSKIDTSDMDNWVFPIGTKLWKEFLQNGVLVETRLLYKMQPGANGWWRVAYLWNADGSDAIAAVDGVPNALGTSHDVPSQNDCWNCHINVRDTAIGVSAIQLSSATGSGALTQLVAAGLLTTPPASEFQPPGQGVVQDALGYLHGNCGHCHNDGSFFAQKSVLRLRLRVSDVDPAQTPTYLTALGVKMYHLIAGTQDGVVRGQPAMSQLYYRMSVRDLNAMPPACTKRVDDAGLATVASWILGL